MKFELDGFLIESNSLIGKYSKFNLYKLNTIQSGKMEGKVLKEAMWFDASLEKCLKEVVRLRMEEERDVKSIEDYIKKFKKIAEKLEKEIARFDKEAIDAIIKSKIVEKAY